MGKTSVYFFSGSGNSLSIAKDLSRTLDAQLIDICSVSEQEEIKTDADAVVFVFPLYDFKAPAFYEKAILKMRDLGSKYIAAVCTYGISASTGMIEFAAFIKKQGGLLSGGFAVKMPHNGIGCAIVKTGQDQKEFTHWKNRLEYVSGYIRDRKTGVLEKRSIVKEALFSGLIFKMLPTLAKIVKIAILKRWDSLAFVADENCDRCGVCARICPVGNIKIDDGRVLWVNKSCAGCMACFHWCPKGAVQFGSLKLNFRQYHHPEVTLKDMTRR